MTPTNREAVEHKCGFMILTPSPLHNGGAWCAEDYPCKDHGEWRENKITSKTTHAVSTIPNGVKKQEGQNREAVEQIKNVISGYLMDIRRGYITATGAWSFPNEEQFDRDVENAIRQTHLDLLREVDREVIALKSELKIMVLPEKKDICVTYNNTVALTVGVITDKLSHIIAREEKYAK